LTPWRLGLVVGRWVDDELADEFAGFLRFHLPFSEWGTVFPDPRLVAAIVDRVAFNAHILETGTPSYRLRTLDVVNAQRESSAPLG
jgi:IstB-like ATP binding protein